MKEVEIVSEMLFHQSRILVNHRTVNKPVNRIDESNGFCRIILGIQIPAMKNRIKISTTRNPVLLLTGIVIIRMVFRNFSVFNR